MRIPVGYWLFRTREQLQAAGAPYVAEGVRYLDAAFDAAAAAGLDVLVNLHGAPGSQNGLQESGQLRDTVGWTADDNVAATLDVLEVCRCLTSRLRRHVPGTPLRARLCFRGQPHPIACGGALTGFNSVAAMSLRGCGVAGVVRLVTVVTFTVTWSYTHQAVASSQAGGSSLRNRPSILSTLGRCCMRIVS